MIEAPFIQTHISSRLMAEDSSFNSEEEAVFESKKRPPAERIQLDMEAEYLPMEHIQIIQK